MQRERFSEHRFFGPGRVRDRFAVWRGRSHAQGTFCTVGKARVHCAPLRLRHKPLPARPRAAVQTTPGLCAGGVALATVDADGLTGGRG